MVYTGKPSAACLACRTARGKCDKKVPTCSQCLRKGILCSGYRDTAALRYRDQTDHVIARYARSTLSGNDPRPSHSVSMVSVITNRDTAVLLQSPSATSVQELSLHFLLRSYIIGLPFEAYLEDFCSPGKTTGGACSLAIQATAYACFAQHTRQKQVLLEARSTYSQVLDQLRQALEDRQVVAEDRTLVAVMIAAVFEAIVFHTRLPTTAWTAHTLALIELLRLRGSAQFDSSMGLKLFLHASQNISASSIQRAVALPEQHSELMNMAEQCLGEQDRSMIMARILKDVASLKNQIFSDPLDSHVLTAIEISRRIDLLLDGISNGGHLPIIYDTSESSHPWSFNGFRYNIKSLRFAKLWIAIQLLRIFLADFVFDYVNNLFPYTTTPFDMRHQLYTRDERSDFVKWAVRTMSEASTSVLASLPCFMILNVGSLSRFGPAAKGLLWSLSEITRCNCSPDVAKAHANAALDKLAKELQMFDAIEASRGSGRESDWLHMYYVG